MNATALRAPIVLLLGALLVVPASQARGETAEEIVAWVDGSVVTGSDLESEEGEKALLDVIDQKILYHRGVQIWDVEAIEESFYRDFRKQQGIPDDEFEKLLEQQGLTEERVKRLLVETHLPDQVREHEVAALMPGISDLEARAYYDRHPDEFTAPDDGRPIPFDECKDRAREALWNERYQQQLSAFMQSAREDAEWWVHPEYRDRLPEGVEPTLEEIPR